MRSLVPSYAAVAVVGAVHSIRRGRPARFVGIRLPGTPAQHAWTIGTPLSAPPLMLAALAVAARRGRDDIVRMLAMLFVVGIAGEVDTWATLRRPAADPLGTACVALDAAIPAAMLWGTR